MTLEFLEAVRFLHRGVDLARLRAALFRQLRDLVVHILLRRRQLFLVSDTVDDDVPSNLLLGHRPELFGELLRLTLRHSIRLDVRSHDLPYPCRRHVERVRAQDLVEELTANGRVGVTLGVRRQVGPHGRSQRIEGLEVAHLAREGVIERRQRLPLHLVEFDTYSLGLAALRLVGEVIGPLHRALDVPAGRELHHQFLDRADHLTGAEHEAVFLGFG
jgi:hypothetical protein